MIFSSTRFKEAFTLLESMIVLGIITMLMGLGIYTVLRVQSYVVLEDGYNSLMSNFKLVQNLARNSTVSSVKLQEVTNPNEAAPDLYGVLFGDESYSPLYCDKDEVSDFYQCFEDQFFLVNTDKNISITSTCHTIMFARSDIDILAINDVGLVETTPKCSIIIKHKRTNEERKIEVDLTLNKF